MKYKIEILSPVHIGTGKQMTPFEFALTRDTYVMFNLERLLLDNPQRAEDLNRHLATESLRFSLSNFLTEDELNARVYWRYAAALTPSTKKALQAELRKAKNMDVHEQIKSGADAQLYLPGSSLKGALRTALAYSTFKTTPDVLKQLKERMTRINWRQSDEAVNELIFWGARHDPKYDLFKTLRVSDSSSLPASPQTLQIGKMKILSLRGASQASSAPSPKFRSAKTPPRGTMFAQLQALQSSPAEDRPSQKSTTHKAPQRKIVYAQHQTQRSSSPERSPLKFWWTFQEVLAPGIAFAADMALDEKLLQSRQARQKLGWKAQHQQHFSLPRLFQAANTFAADICAWELQFFQHEVKGIDVKPVVQFYRQLQTEIAQADEETCYLCVGQGAGWHKMTVGMLLAQADDFDFEKLRKTLRLADRRLEFAYPKSRKLLMASDNAIDQNGVFGWVKIQCQPTEKLSKS